MSIRLAAFAAAIGIFAAIAQPALAQQSAAPATAPEGKTTELADGLKYTDTKIGDGETAQKGYIVSVNYTGWLYKNGNKGAEFDSSSKAGKPFTFTLGKHQVIEGWEEGISGMKAGGKRTLIFEVELISAR